jgi:cytochrome c oxidase subunit IV
MSTEHVHIIPRRTYYIIFGVLMLCTYLTWQVAYFDLGPLNTVAALGIAFFKATLVVLFFMHVKYSTRLTWAVVLGSIFWLGILLTLTMNDYVTRLWGTYGAS